MTIAGVFAVVIAFRWRPPYDYGELTPQVEAATKRLAASPCDHAAAVDLAQAMTHAGDARGVLAMADRFFEKCGDEPRLRWDTFSAHKQLGQWDAAIDDASRLIESDPSDKDFRWWRGSVYERKGDLARAAIDYEKTIELEPRVTNIPINLADVYERMKRPCDADRVLHRFLLEYPDSARVLQPRIDALDLRCTPGSPM